jgi:hypothetical protein
VHDTWGARDLPVLDATVSLLEQSYMVTVTDIAARTGLEASAVAKALEALDPVYVDFRKTTTGGDPRFWYVFKVTPEARRTVGQWPTPQSLANRLADEFAGAAQSEADPERQALLSYAARLIGDTLQDYTVRAAASVLAPALGSVQLPEAEALPLPGPLPEPDAQPAPAVLPELPALPDPAGPPQRSVWSRAQEQPRSGGSPAAAEDAGPGQAAAPAGRPRIIDRPVTSRWPEADQRPASGPDPAAEQAAGGRDPVRHEPVAPGREPVPDRQAAPGRDDVAESWVAAFRPEEPERRPADQPEPDSPESRPGAATWAGLAAWSGSGAWSRPQAAFSPPARPAPAGQPVEADGDKAGSAGQAGQHESARQGQDGPEEGGPEHAGQEQVESPSPEAAGPQRAPLPERTTFPGSSSFAARRPAWPAVDDVPGPEDASGDADDDTDLDLVQSRPDAV